MEAIYYWNPQSSPALCAVFNGQACTQCLPGYIVDNNRCVLVASFFHLTFDNHLYDMSNNARHVILGNVPDDFRFATV